MSEEVRARLFDSAEVYALHAVDPAEAAEIERDLESVDDTARGQFNSLVGEIQEALALTSARDAVEPPAELRARVLDHTQRMTQESPSAPSVSNVTSMSSHRERRSNRWRTTLMVAAAAVVVAVGGGVVATQMIGNDPSPTQAEQIIAADDSRQTTANLPGGGTATVFYSRESNSAVVTMEGVPAPAPGKDYQMWLVDGTPRSVGLMTPEQLNDGTETVIEGMGASTNFGISLEPDGGSAQPTEVLAMVTLAT